MRFRSETEMEDKEGKNPKEIQWVCRRVAWVAREKEREGVGVEATQHLYYMIERMMENGFSEYRVGGGRKRKKRGSLHRRT